MTFQQTVTVEQAPLDGFVLIPAGTFMMGSPLSEAEREDNETPHQVTISKPFYIGKYELTQEEWVEVMGSNPSEFKGDNLPVEQVSWYDAVGYCNARSEKEGLTPAYRGSGKDITCDMGVSGYRLPTEAEWEYACRAGTTTPFYRGNNITTAYANYNGKRPYNGNAKGVYRQKTWAVGSGKPNPWGLYDMSGNVWEWCWDWFGDYASGSQTDPMGASSGSDRVQRGGCYFSDGQALRSASRHHYAPYGRFSSIGFRLVRSGV